MTAVWTYNPDQSWQVAYSGVVSQTYAAYTAFYNAAGVEVSAAFSNGAAEPWTPRSDGSDSGALVDSAIDIESLTADDLINLGGSSVHSIQSRDASLQFSVAQAVAIEHDDANFAQGWHRAERHAGGVIQRWSAGCAAAPARARIVIRETARRGSYWRATPQAAGTELHAERIYVAGSRG